MYVTNRRNFKMELSAKKQNVFSEYLKVLKPVKAKKVLVLNNVIKIVISKQKEDCLIVDLDDTFTLKEYLENIYGLEYLENKQKSAVVRTSTARSFNLLAKEKELSEFLKAKLPSEYKKPILTLKNYLKEVHGDLIVKNEAEYNQASDVVFSEFLKFAEKNLEELPTLQPLLKSWRFLV
jgi:hypothetical protein